MDHNLASQVLQLSAHKAELCYHCHKCSAGCPVLHVMQYGPDLILQMVALDERDLVLGSKDIWLCAGCYTCSTRCPNDIEIPAVMDALRQIVLREGYPVGERNAYLFHRLFMAVIGHLGRSHEAAMLAMFKVFSRLPLMNDMQAGIGLFMRGKVPLLPQITKARQGVREIMNGVNK
jgi:heterodisulfide reductase subunit C2